MRKSVVSRPLPRAGSASDSRNGTAASAPCAQARGSRLRHRHFAQTAAAGVTPTLRAPGARACRRYAPTACCPCWWLYGLLPLRCSGRALPQRGRRWQAQRAPAPRRAAPSWLPPETCTQPGAQYGLGAARTGVKREGPGKPRRTRRAPRRRLLRVAARRRSLRLARDFSSGYRVAIIIQSPCASLVLRACRRVSAYSRTGSRCSERLRAFAPWRRRCRVQ